MGINKGSNRGFWIERLEGPDSRSPNLENLDYKSMILQKQSKLIATIDNSTVGKDVVLMHLTGREALSELFTYEAVFTSSNAKINGEKILGTSFSITIKTEKRERIINGIVSEFSQGVSAKKEDIYLTEYRAIIRPSLWNLTLDENYLIFQKKAALDIIKSVLDKGGVKNTSVKVSSCGKTKREYCVQYGESSFNFISRLMEDEGIFYYFKHEKGKHTLVLADSTSAYQAISGDKNVEVATAISGTFPIGKIFSTYMTTYTNTGEYHLSDYNYETSTAKLMSKGKSKTKGPTLYQHPGDFEKPADGDKLVKLRVEMLDWQRKIFKGSSTLQSMCPGFTFKLVDHHVSSFNAEFTVIAVKHSFNVIDNLPIYMNEFLAIPKGVVFRPELTTPKPRIYGSQTAIVTTPSGSDEISVGKHGSIKVSFYWDMVGKRANTADSSCWIRVAQMISGNGWGFLFIPRVGQEVIVNFLNGDPDRPLVVGCVYNDKNLPVYTEKQSMISGMKSVTFKGDKKKQSNEWRINDEKDKEEIYWHAQKDIKYEIENDRFATLKEGNDTLLIEKGNAVSTIKEGNQTVTLNKGDIKFVVEKGSSQGDIKKNFTLTVGGDLVIKAEGKISFESGKDMLFKSKGKYTMDASGTTLFKSGKDVKIQSGTDMKINGGTAVTVQSGTDMKIKGGTAVTVQSGTDMKINGGTNTTIEGAINFNMKAGVNWAVKANVGVKLEANVTMELKSSLQFKANGLMGEFGCQTMCKISAPMTMIGGGMVKLG